MIRQAQDGDRSAIWDILRHIFRSGETYAIPRDISEEAALEYWCGADRKTFVLDNGAVEGTFYIKANQLGGGAHIANAGFAVHASSAGKGYAEKMLVFAEDFARKNGFLSMQFNFVVSTNIAAIRIWERNGYQQIGQIPDAFQHPEHGLVNANIYYKRLVP